MDGEFQILNRNFEYEMLDKESTVFKELASNLTTEVSHLRSRNTFAYMTGPGRV